MDFLFDNPLANLPGPIFLVLYGAIIFFSAIAFYLLKLSFDWTANQNAPLIPSNPDPFEIAYLRGGENEFARALVFALNQKGFLKITNEGKKSYIVLAQTQPNWTTLSPIERTSLTWFQTTRETSEIFSNYGLTEIIRPFAITYEQKINQNNLLTPDDVKNKTRIFSLLIFGAIAVLGGYKLVAALLHGHKNVLFLIILTVVAFIIFLVLGKTKRLSQLGIRYVESLQTTFDRLRYNQTTSPNMPSINAIDPTLLAVGIFGTTILAGTAYGDYEQAFHRSSVSGGSSCGSGCGSSCSSGGDGGSSCSGGSSCGGGGCGGCGGGGCS